MMCSSRVFMVMELSGNRGGKNRVLGEGTAGWQVGEANDEREDDRDENTPQDDGQKKWNKQDEATRSNRKSAVLRSRWEKQTFPSLRRPAIGQGIRFGNFGWEKFAGLVVITERGAEGSRGIAATGTGGTS